MFGASLKLATTMIAGLVVYRLLSMFMMTFCIIAALKLIFRKGTKYMPTALALIFIPGPIMCLCLADEFLNRSQVSLSTVLNILITHPVSLISEKPSKIVTVRFWARSFDMIRRLKREEGIMRCFGLAMFFIGSYNALEPFVIHANTMKRIVTLWFVLTQGRSKKDILSMSKMKTKMIKRLSSGVNK